MAVNRKNVTPPKTVRQFRSGMEYLPALWAAGGDTVVVQDKLRAQAAVERLRAELSAAGCRVPARVEFAAREELAGRTFAQMDVWGWDKAVIAAIGKAGIACSALPDEDRLDTIRMLSHRKTAAGVLADLGGDGLAGEAFFCRTEAEVAALACRYGRTVIKAPWSCSGRGVRFAEGSIGEPLSGWIKNMLKAQGGVTVEPYYNKVTDFGMEFRSDGIGRVEYLGLSLFVTRHGAYTGNLLATEARKREMLERHVPGSLLDSVRERLCNRLGRLYRGKYAGLLGVDMMVVEGADGRSFALHPCVEINLRRTMGHVALALSPEDDGTAATMEIETNNNYQLNIKSL